LSTGSSSDPPPECGNEVERNEEEVVDAHVVEQPGRRNPRLELGLQQSRYTSPLPSPDDLDRYVQHLPDAAERLLAAGEREQAHRHEIENRLAAIDEKAMPEFYAGQKRGHYISLLLGLAYLGVMVVAILKGETLIGAGGAALGIGAMIWAARRDSSGSDDPPSAKPTETPPPPDQQPRR
jgi:uncharacterized membrane protein